jgi:glycosyltransferase involved in cell wall biosynthesis
MTNICVYGTVYNNAGTVEESIRSVWKPEYEIVIVDNYSTDGTWEKLLELKNEFNLRLYRYKCSRGLGRNIALHKCPENSLTAYFDLDTKYNHAFHRVIEAAEEYGSASAHALVVDREYAIRRGGWRDLNVAEDLDFEVRMYPRIHVPVIVGENANPELPLYLRERRYARGTLGFLRRLLKTYLDTTVGYGINVMNMLKIRSKRILAISPIIIPYAKLKGAHSYYDDLPNYSTENLERLSRITPPRKLGINEDLFFFYMDYHACKVLRECSSLDNIVKSIVSPPIIKLSGISIIFWITYVKSIEIALRCIPRKSLTGTTKVRKEVVNWSESSNYCSPASGSWWWS